MSSDQASKGSLGHPEKFLLNSSQDEQLEEEAVLPDHNPCSELVRIADNDQQYLSEYENRSSHFSSREPVIDVLSRTSCAICVITSSLILRHPRFRDAWKSQEHLRIGNWLNGYGVYLREHFLGRLQPFHLSMLSQKRAYCEGLGHLPDLKQHMNLSFSEPPHVSFDNSRQLDIGMAQRWLQVCIMSHQGCHGNSQGERLSKPLDLLFIDVEEKRLVRGSSSDIYLALSYVSGGTQKLQTSNDNFGSLQRRGAIGGSDFRLPQLFADAMSLVKSLGFRYLWIDALCIVQDDITAKHGQIMQMDAIYSQAHLTIVALSSQNSESKLPGVSQGSRSPIRAFAKVDPNYGFASIPPQLGELLDSSVYEERGWTFQERLLSKRCLYLTDFQAYFTCSTLSNPIREDGLTEIFGLGEADRPKWPETQNGTWTWEQGFRNYVWLLQRYTTRKLSYEKDIINAFSGLSAILQHRCGGSFIYGLPESIFDVALLWFPGDNSLVRRQNEITGQTFPSWSWAAWKGKVSYLEYYNLSDNTEDYLGYLNFVIHPEISSFHVEDTSGYRLIDRSAMVNFSGQERPRSTLNFAQDSNQSRSYTSRPILHFQTYSATPIGLSLRRQNFQIWVSGTVGFDLVDTESISHGIFLGSMDWPESFCLNSDMELILLFRNISSPDRSGPNSLPSLTGRKPHLNTSFNPYGYRSSRREDSESESDWKWSLFILMLIEWTGDVAERVGIVMMYEADYLKLQPKVKDIQLI